MGCIPQFHPLPNAREPEPDWLGGYLCVCHGSKYDLAGRVFKGGLVPYNLPVPPYRFVNDHTIRIGENPPRVKFHFRSILQIYAWSGKSSTRLVHHPGSNSSNGLCSMRGDSRSPARCSISMSASGNSASETTPPAGLRSASARASS